MNKIKLGLATLATGTLFLVGCTTEEVTTKPTEEVAQSEEFVMEVVADEEVVTSESLVTDGETTLLDLTKDNLDVVEENSFVTAIEGIEQSESDNKYWVFEVNDEMVNVGAEEYIVEPGEKVSWILMEF